MVVRVVPVAGADARGDGHRIEMQFLSGAGWVQADGKRVRIEPGVGLDFAAERIELDDGFSVLAAPSVTAGDDVDAPMIELQSRAHPSDRAGSADAVFRDVRGHVKATSAGKGAVDLTLQFDKEDRRGRGAEVPPDGQYQRMTVHLVDGQSALLATDLLGEVRLR